jgi:hypothetical protein
VKYSQSGAWAYLSSTADWIAKGKMRAANTQALSTEVELSLPPNSDFLTLIRETTIDGFAAAFRFDGTYTDVTPVPIPGACALLISGLGLLAAVRIRRGRGATVIFRAARA